MRAHLYRKMLGMEVHACPPDTVESMDRRRMVQA
jgi:hypothetical protein